MYDRHHFPIKQRNTIKGNLSISGKYQINVYEKLVSKECFEIVLPIKIQNTSISEEKRHVFNRVTIFISVVSLSTVLLFISDENVHNTSNFQAKTPQNTFFTDELPVACCWIKLQACNVINKILQHWCFPVLIFIFTFISLKSDSHV